MEKAKIYVLTDEDCEMISIEVNGKCISYGNEWGHHGTDQLDAIESAFKIVGVPYELIRKEKPYEEWE